MGVDGTSGMQIIGGPYNTPAADITPITVAGAEFIPSTVEDPTIIEDVA